MYCDNNPVNCIDASGLAKIVIVVGEGNPGEEQFPGRFLDLAGKLKAKLEAEGHTVIVLKGPSEGALQSEVASADGLIYIGHGYSRGVNVSQGRGSVKGWGLSPQGLAAMLNGRKLLYIITITCSQFNNKDNSTADGWAKLCNDYYGYFGVLPHVQDFLNNWNKWIKDGPKDIALGKIPRRWNPGPSGRGGKAGIPLPRIF